MRVKILLPIPSEIVVTDEALDGLVGQCVRLVEGAEPTAVVVAERVEDGIELTIEVPSVSVPLSSGLDLYSTSIEVDDEKAKRSAKDFLDRHLR